MVVVVHYSQSDRTNIIPISIMFMSARKAYAHQPTNQPPHKRTQCAKHRERADPQPSSPSHPSCHSVARMYIPVRTNKHTHTRALNHTLPHTAFRQWCYAGTAAAAAMFSQSISLCKTQPSPNPLARPLRMRCVWLVGTDAPYLEN